MRKKRRSVQDVGVRVSSESGVRNFIDINNNDATNQPSPEDDDHDNNHDDHNDHTFTFTELYDKIMNNSEQANNNEAADESDVVMTFNDINNNDATNQQRPEDDDHDHKHNDNRDHTFTFTEVLPTAADLNNKAEPIMNYNDLNNHDA
eukprot:CAMPEP_0170772620 /NCGR_PEP_ID=MMETSP0733-20121128/8858_1 /TAXON_ID=186038 /ORGANISM="Fragilariopsis kerguelensis, Strain L26-C5" /LENGTH=147 /DNA_ID=CAMNT_0011114795 /DNA_START=68 /DNA_END=507 /DNA_ORIENTATION=+